MNDPELFFDQIYKDNYPKVFRLCLGYVGGDDMAAKELSQEVFIKAWECLGRFRKEAQISTWIYRITVNTSLMYLRKESRKKEIPLQEWDQVEEESSATVRKESQMKQLYECINKLPETHRTILLLELEDVPQKEIAEIIGISHSALRVRIHRIKNELTKCVKNDKF